MSLRKEDAYQYALCMDLTEDKFQYSIVDPSSKKIIEQHVFQLDSYERGHVDQFLAVEAFNYDFASYSLTAGTLRNTLIPVDLFSYSKPKEIFQLNYPEPIDNLDYNRIPELGIVNIYEVPLWIKTLFVIRFPRVKIIHRATVLLKGVFDEPAYRPKIHLHIDDHHFYYLITEKSKLIYFNCFEYKELSDIAYYVLFVLEQKELSQSDYEINVMGQSQDWQDLTKFQNFFKSKIKIDSSKEKASDFLLAKQLLCV